MALASGYREVEYIQMPSSGNPYINTGFATKNTSRLVMDFEMVTGSANYITIFGGRDRANSSLRSFCFWKLNNSTGFRTDFGSNTKNITTDTNLGRYTGDKNGTKTTMTNASTGAVDTATNTSATFTTSSQLYLFNINSLNTADNRAPHNMKLYSCQIYDNGTLIRDFVPCRRTSDNVAGLWDQVNSKFYGPSGSGSFIAGPDLVNFNAKAKIAGEWKELVNGYVKINGEWKEITGVEEKAGSWKA